MQKTIIPLPATIGNVHFLDDSVWVEYSGLGFSFFLFFWIFSIWAGDHFFHSSIPGKILAHMNPMSSPWTGYVHSCRLLIPAIVPTFSFPTQSTNIIADKQNIVW